MLSLGPTAAPKIATENLDMYNSLTVKDRLGSSQTLYFRENTEKGIDLDQYEMPPVPPAGIVDVRFASGRTLESYPLAIKDPVEFAITTQSLEYPVEVKWNVSDASGKGFEVVEKDNDKVVATHILNGPTGSFTMSRAMSALGLRVGEGKLIPKEFALVQNYPNPFNPSTIIKFDLPNSALVTLKVYNILGQEVVLLVNGKRTAGFYQVEFNGSNLTSGVYFYRLEAVSETDPGKTFTQVKKMLLMK